MNPPKQITDLETEYNECIKNLNLYNIQVTLEEKKIISCLQKLMPLQNNFLSNIIKVQQKQINLLKKGTPPLETINEDHDDDKDN